MGGIFLMIETHKGYSCCTPIKWCLDKYTYLLVQQTLLYRFRTRHPVGNRCACWLMEPESMCHRTQCLYWSKKRCYNNLQKNNNNKKQTKKQQNKQKKPKKNQKKTKY